jgi:GH43 family beta-xylosidase
MLHSPMTIAAKHIMLASPDLPQHRKGKLGETTPAVQWHADAVFLPTRSILAKVETVISQLTDVDPNSIKTVYPRTSSYRNRQPSGPSERLHYVYVYSLRCRA